MAIADRAAAFLSQVAPVLKDAAGNSMSQMQAVVKQAQQPVAGFLSQVGTAAGSMLGGTPPAIETGSAAAFRPRKGSYQQLKKPVETQFTSATPTPGGLLGGIGMNKTALNVQSAMLDPQMQQRLGAGVLGAGALGLGAAGIGAAALMNRKKKERMAGQSLGAQLGVGMPAA